MMNEKEISDLKQTSFRVSKALLKRLKQYCLDHDSNQTRELHNALVAHLEKPQVQSEGGRDILAAVAEVLLQEPNSDEAKLIRKYAEIYAKRTARAKAATQSEGDLARRKKA